MSLKKTIKNILAFTYYNFFRKHQNITGNRVILYHAIGSELEHDSYGISIAKDKFVEHMKFLKENYEIIPIDKHYKTNLNRNTVSVTFDDGYKDNLFALEICEKYNIPFTLYITTGSINDKDYLSEHEIEKFNKSDKCILGTHSVTHPHLNQLNYDKQFYELDESKKRLESIINNEITCMSYPNGSYNKDTLEIVNKLDYKINTSSNIGINTIENFDSNSIKRIEIVASDDLKDLKNKIDGYYDYLSYKNIKIG